jgi:hypothetical protein
MADPQRYDIAGLLDAMRFVESTNRLGAVSKKGAVGDMQQIARNTMDPGYEIPTIFDVGAMYGMQPKQDVAGANSLSMDPEIARRWAYEYLTGAHRAFNTDLDQIITGYNAGLPSMRDYDAASHPSKEAREYAPKVRAAYEQITGQKLPEQGYFGAPIYNPGRPKRRPVGLLEM